MFVFWQRDMILHGKISIRQYESTSDGVRECISQRTYAFIIACERRSPKSVSRKTFLFLKPL